jgi:Zn-dependent protease with chaperone function
MMIYLLTFLIATFLAWGLNALELIPWRRAAAAHWTEQARQLYPALAGRRANIKAIPACLTLLTRIFYPESAWGLVLSLAFLGTLLGNFPMDRATNPGLSFGDWAHQVCCSWILSFIGWANYIAAAALMPATLGWSALAVTAGFFTVFLALQFGLALRLMRAMRLLLPARPRLHALVDATSTAMGVPVRATWEMAGTAATAFAFVTTRELAFSTKLVDASTDDELKAICAHELGHLTESRWTLAGRILGALMLFPLIFARPAYELGREAGWAALGFLVLGIWYGHLRLAQAMEKRADRVARESVEEATTYARALERIHRINLVPAVLQKDARLIHPDLYDRMLAAGVTPEYPRPTPPTSHGSTGILMTVFATIMAMCLFIPR